MWTSLAIGVAGGVAAAILFAAILGGGAFALPLSLISPLPIAIVGLGWGTLPGFVAAIVAIITVSSVMSPTVAFGFGLVTALPMAYYAYLAGLARPADETGTGPATAAEWYPIGRIASRIAFVTAASLVVVGFVGGFSIESFVESFRLALAEAIDDPAEVARLQDADTDGMIRLYVSLMPLTLALFWTGMMALDLWLAAMVVRISGRFLRPKDDITVRFQLEPSLVAVFAVAVAVSFAPGELGLVARAFAGALAMVLSIAGFAVVHVLTRGNAARGIVLATIYGVTLLFFSLPLLVMTVLGAADTLLGLRRRKLAGPD
ncbi:hypothetical protein [Methylobrevis albus]|uniref:DUF2232 domain-containing protein n=1 Tax=Methylobrevis albus TaxID=2793297 RepID=A0A931MZP9_9HYPH|nr:hypothetical protein [Methylobrevis albus]MBH0239662.1 hypothetical protein [Methylobrevis albus]